MPSLRDRRRKREAKAAAKAAAPAIEPDPQVDGGLPWTRADEAQCAAIADYYEEEIKGNV